MFWLKKRKQVLFWLVKNAIYELLYSHSHRFFLKYVVVHDVAKNHFWDTNVSVGLSFLTLSRNDQSIDYCKFFYVDLCSILVKFLTYQVVLWFCPRHQLQLLIIMVVKMQKNSNLIILYIQLLFIYFLNWILA